ncbi:MAG TPA: S41 family peptidase [Cyclobacteriaceae bacterium]|nr:S41 family peptidase [Cyclobacteriaceae bacterium]
MNKIKLRALSLSVLVSSAFLCYSQSPEQPNKALQKLETDLEGGQYEISYYNTACYFAIAGKPSLAFRYLAQAIDNGFSQLDVMEQDTDLQSLHQDPRWAVMQKNVQQNLTRKQKMDKLFFNQKSFWESGAIETPYSQNISDNEKIAGLSKFWSEAKYNFVNFDLVSRLNFDSLYLSYLPKVRQTKSTLEYYLVLEQFAAVLSDGHTNVNMPRELVDSVYARPLLRTRLIEDKVLIVGVYDPLLSQKGISVGQEVIMVNGLPVKDYAARYVIPYQSSSTPQDRMVRAYDYALLGGSLNKPIKLQLRNASNKISEHIIQRVKPEERSKKLRTPTFLFRMLPGNIAYVALNTFGNDSTYIEFKARFEEISKAKAIIFDVRNNGGGNTSPGWNILSCLIDTSASVHTSYTREYRPTYRAWNNNQDVHVYQDDLFPNKKLLYTKPVVVLTSARTFSAAEDFAAAFKTMNRGLIIGEATGGSSGQPLGFRMPGNGTARICTKRDMLGNGDDFVGRGIQPDKVVAPTINDIRKGVDTELQAAIREVMK